MKTNTKQWRRWKRRQRLLNVRIAKRRIAKLLAKLPNLTAAQAERHNRLAKFVNYLVNYPAEEGVAIIEGAVDCPECGKEIWMMADPTCWTERPQPGWRRRRSNRRVSWKVGGYGPGIAECCTGFAASQPDGQCDFYRP